MMLWKGGGVRDREQPDGCSGAALPPPTGAGSTVAGGAAGGVGPWRWRTGVRLAKLVPDYRRSFLFSISRLALRAMNVSMARSSTQRMLALLVEQDAMPDPTHRRLARAVGCG